LLFLPAEEQGPYRLVSLAIEELAAPYARLTVIRGVVELIALALTAAAVATLHSVRERKTHETTTLCVAAIFFAGMALNWLHDRLVQRALIQLPNRVCQWTSNCSEVLELAMRADARLVTEYGFWDHPHNTSS
jgi:hypothetical protein